MPEKTLQDYQKNIQGYDDLYTGRGFAGASLTFDLYDSNGTGLIARGTGLSWSEQYQNFPVLEWGHNATTEIIIGAMQPGQLQFNSLFYFKINDKLPTFQSIRKFRELTAKISISDDYADVNAVNLRGMVVDYFEGVYITAQQSNWNAQSMALRNGTMMYRKRYSPEEYYTHLNGQ